MLNIRQNLSVLSSIRSAQVPWNGLLFSVIIARKLVTLIFINERYFPVAFIPHHMAMSLRKEDVPS